MKSPQTTTTAKQLIEVLTKFVNSHGNNSTWEVEDDYLLLVPEDGSDEVIVRAFDFDGDLEDSE